MRRIIIIKTGTTAPEVLEEFGDYDRWFTEAMSHHDVEFDVRDITRSPFPETREAAGVIVTGATSAAYRPEPWMEGLAGWLRVAEKGPPVLCVCLGAQLLAQARGGTVILNPAGWEIGGIRVDLTPEGEGDPLFAGLPSSIDVFATHEDAITRLPAGCVDLGRNSHSQQAFRIGDSVWGLQFHPEITPAILDRLIHLRSGALIEEARRLGQPDPEHRVARLIDGLSRHETGTGRAILDNFVGLCRT